MILITNSLTPQTFGTGVEHALSKRADATVEDAAVAFIKDKLSVSEDSVYIRSTSSNDGIQHAYVQQKVNGIPVANAVANVAFNRQNNVVAFGSNFVKTSEIASSTPKISQEQAISVAESALGGKYNKKPIGLEYVSCAET